MTSIAREQCPGEVTQFFGGRAGLRPLGQRREPRGCLVPFGFDALPFSPKHAFLVRDVPAGTKRGQHALQNAELFLVCLSGRLRVTLRERSLTERVDLERPDIGLFIAAGLWNAQTYLTDHTMMLAFASEPYASFQYSPKPMT